MNWRFLIVAVCIACIIAETWAQREKKEKKEKKEKGENRGAGKRGNRGRGRGLPGNMRWKGMNLPNSDKYSWERSIGGDLSVNETAFSITNKSVVVYVSRDKGLRSAPTPLSPSVSVYDYSSGEGLVAVRLLKRGSPCYIITTNSSLSFSDLIVDLESRNGSTGVVANSTMRLNATSLPLPKRQGAQLLKEHKGAKRLCRRTSGVVMATPIDATVSDDDESLNGTRKVDFLMEDAHATLFLPIDIVSPPKPVPTFF